MSNDEILREFLLETHENLGLLDADLIELEKKPTAKNTLAQVFRTLHSVKGTAGFMGLVKLQTVAHAAESLLSRLRAGELLFNPTVATALLGVVDAIREIVSNIEASGSEGSGDYTALIAEVDRLREGRGASALPADSRAASERPIQTSVQQPPTENFTVVDLDIEARTLSDRDSIADSASGDTLVLPSMSASGINPDIQDTARPASVSVDPPKEAAGKTSGGRTASVVDANIRVDVGLLDKLMTLVGELVLARNQIMQQSVSFEGDEFLGTVQRLNLLTSELQASAMKMRMQPIGIVLNKFPRIVRDLALACGKKVRFEMVGQETELDKSLIEAIRDPLTHIVRNAVDHGIETPAVRQSLGKSDEGRLRMIACHEGGKVIIQITDDGAGVDVDRVRRKAIANKLVSPETVDRMDSQELLQLLFLPGFSTADQVTQFSGRGVGMDVVRTNIEKIGGTVDIESVPGLGTTIRTKIPLTLAIIPALIIGSGGERFAIPQVSLLELLRLDFEQTQQRIERIYGAPVYRLREALLPLVFLDEQLDLEVPHGAEQDLNIIVMQADDQPFGLVVEAIGDTEEIVVKPLQKQLKGVSVFAGAAIMGDGRIALVLDVLGLANRASVVSIAKNRARAEPDLPSQPAVVGTQSLLLFVPNEGGQMAVELSHVARLEEFLRAKIECLGSRQVVQYRGEILPLVDVSEMLEQLRRAGQRTPTERSAVCQDTPSSQSGIGPPDTIPVVVCEVDDQRFGLLVGKVLDIVDVEITSRSRANRPGVLFTAIVQEKITEIVDVAALVSEAASELLSPTS